MRPGIEIEPHRVTRTCGICNAAFTATGVGPSMMPPSSTASHRLPLLYKCAGCLQLIGPPDTNEPHLHRHPLTPRVAKPSPARSRSLSVNNSRYTVVAPPKTVGALQKDVAAVAWRNKANAVLTFAVHRLSHISWREIADNVRGTGWTAAALKAAEAGAPKPPLHIKLRVEITVGTMKGVTAPFQHIFGGGKNEMRHSRRLKRGGPPVSWDEQFDIPMSGISSITSPFVASIVEETTGRTLATAQVSLVDLFSTPHQVECRWILWAARSDVPTSEVPEFGHLVVSWDLHVPGMNLQQQQQHQGGGDINNIRGAGGYAPIGMELHQSDLPPHHQQHHDGGDDNDHHQHAQHAQHAPLVIVISRGTGLRNVRCPLVLVSQGDLEAVTAAPIVINEETGDAEWQQELQFPAFDPSQDRRLFLALYERPAVESGESVEDALTSAEIKSVGLMEIQQPSGTAIVPLSDRDERTKECLGEIIVSWSCEDERSFLVGNDEEVQQQQDDDYNNSNSNNNKSSLPPLASKPIAATSTNATAASPFASSPADDKDGDGEHQQQLQNSNGNGNSNDQQTTLNENSEATPVKASGDAVAEKHDDHGSGNRIINNNGPSSSNNNQRDSSNTPGSRSASAEHQQPVTMTSPASRISTSPVRGDRKGTTDGETQDQTGSENGSQGHNNGTDDNSSPPPTTVLPASANLSPDFRKAAHVTDDEPETQTSTGDNVAQPPASASAAAADDGAAAKEQADHSNNNNNDNATSNSSNANNDDDARKNNSDIPRGGEQANKAAAVDEASEKETGSRNDNINKGASSPSSAQDHSASAADGVTDATAGTAGPGSPQQETADAKDSNNNVNNDNNAGSSSTSTQQQPTADEKKDGDSNDESGIPVIGARGSRLTKGSRPHQSSAAVSNSDTRDSMAPSEITAATTREPSVVEAGESSSSAASGANNTKDEATNKTADDEQTQQQESEASGGSKSSSPPSNNNDSDANRNKVKEEEEEGRESKKQQTKQQQRDAEMRQEEEQEARLPGYEDPPIIGRRRRGKYLERRAKSPDRVRDVSVPTSVQEQQSVGHSPIGMQYVARNIGAGFGRTSATSAAAAPGSVQLLLVPVGSTSSSPAGRFSGQHNNNSNNNNNSVNDIDGGDAVPPSNRPLDLSGVPSWWAEAIQHPESHCAIMNDAENREQSAYRMMDEELSVISSSDADVEERARVSVAHDAKAPVQPRATWYPSGNPQQQLHPKFPVIRKAITTAHKDAVRLGEELHDRKLMIKHQREEMARITAGGDGSHHHPAAIAYHDDDDHHHHHHHHHEQQMLPAIEDVHHDGVNEEVFQQEPVPTDPQANY